MRTTVLAAVIVVAVLVLLAVVFLLRLRILAGRVGSFECALRLPGERRWTSGIATLGDDHVEWSRLVSLYPRPRYRIARGDIELGQFHHRGVNGRVVEVDCRCREHSCELAMLEDSYSALVAWLESAAPTQPSLF